MSFCWWFKFHNINCFIVSNTPKIIQLIDIPNILSTFFKINVNYSIKQYKTILLILLLTALLNEVGF